MTPKEEAKEILNFVEGIGIVEGGGLWFRAKRKRIADALTRRDERIRELESSMEKHFIEKHLEADGPKIDRLERTIASLESEIERLKEENKTYQALNCELRKTQRPLAERALDFAEFKNLHNRVRELEWALKRYGRHSSICVNMDNSLECVCGLEYLMGAKPKGEGK